MQQIIKAVRRAFGSGSLFHRPFYNELQVAFHDEKKNDFSSPEIKDRQLRRLKVELKRDGFMLTREVTGDLIRHPRKKWWGRIRLLKPCHVRIERLRRLTAGERSIPREIGPKGYTDAEVKKFAEILAKRIARKKTAIK